MGFAGKHAQHFCGVPGIARFFQHFTVQDDNGIRAQNGQIARCQRDASLRLFARQTDHILLSALLRAAQFLNTGNHALKSEAKLSQQFLPTRRT